MPIAFLRYAPLALKSLWFDHLVRILILQLTNQGKSGSNHSLWLSAFCPSAFLPFRPFTPASASYKYGQVHPEKDWKYHSHCNIQATTDPVGYLLIWHRNREIVRKR